MLTPPYSEIRKYVSQIIDVHTDTTSVLRLTVLSSSNFFLVSLL